MGCAWAWASPTMHGMMSKVSAVISKDRSQSINTIGSLKHVKDALFVQLSLLAETAENFSHIWVPQTVRRPKTLLNKGSSAGSPKANGPGVLPRWANVWAALHGKWEHAQLDPHPWLFRSTGGLSDEQAKKLWMVLQRSLVTIPHDSSLLALVVRITERGKKLTGVHLTKKANWFVPSRRSNNWKEKMSAILNRNTRIEGTQADTGESDKRWFVCHLEIISEYILDDLIFARNLMGTCFLPYYEVCRNLLNTNTNHRAPSPWIQELELGDLEANEITSLLLWAWNTYPGPGMMGNMELAPGVDFDGLEVSPSPNMVSELFPESVSTLSSNIIARLPKGPEIDRKDCTKNNTEPEADQYGCYHPTFPVIIFQVFERILQVASQTHTWRSENKGTSLCLQLDRYKDEGWFYEEIYMGNYQYT